MSRRKNFISGAVGAALMLTCLVGLLWYAADSRAERPKVVDVAPPPVTSPIVVVPTNEGTITPASLVPTELEADQVAAPPAPLVVEQPVVVSAPPATVAVDDPFTMSGKIVGVGELRRISLLVNGQGHVFTVEPTATITLNGNPATLADLSAGMSGRVRMLETDPTRVVEVAAFQRIGCGVSFYAGPIAYMGVRLDASDMGANGVQILDIFEGSPADTANLYIGDRITAIDNVEMQNSKQILATIRGHRPNEELRVDVVRDGQTIAVPIVLAERRPRSTGFEEFACGCGCSLRTRDLERPASSLTDSDSIERQRQLLVENQRLLQELQNEVRDLRADLVRTARR